MLALSTRLRSSSVLRLFEEQVAKTPQAVALVCEDSRLTYADLNARANRLARFLQTRAAGTSLIPAYLERSIDAIVCFLAVMKSGSGFVPLDANLPSARLRYQLAEIESPILLTQSRCLTTLPPEYEGEIVCLDRDREIFVAYSPHNLEEDSTLNRTAYLIYTSGSTGHPKGVVISYANLANYATFIFAKLGLAAAPARSFAFVSSLDTDLGLTCIFPSLISGGSLHVLPPQLVKDPERFAAYMSRERIDVLKITPSHFSALMAARDAINVFPREFLILGGEALSFSLCDQIMALEPPCRIINHYGPTETTVGVICTEVNHLNSWRSICSTVPIGKPIHNVHVHVLDSNLEPVPHGEIGELYIGGESVGNGYFKKPGLTAEHFICDWVSGSPGARLYKTGDLGRLLPDENIEFIGRADRQIKIRGFRVELNEIEATLLRHDRVRQTAVLAHTENNHKRLIAYVIPAIVPDLEGGLDERGLREFLRQQLPSYMLPSDIIFLEEFPLTASGKTDYKAFAVPQLDPLAANDSIFETQSWEEKLIEFTWRKCLRRSAVKRTDNFFELGGDSIVAIQISAELRQKKIHLTPQQFFDFPTIAEQVSVCRTASAEETVAMQRHETGGAFPLLPIQRWFFEQQFLEPHHWNQAVLLDIKGMLEPDFLREAIRQVLLHHDGLRLRFLQDNDSDEQGIAALTEVPFDHEDLAGYPVAARQRALLKTAQLAQASLNLSNGPLFRCLLFSFPPDESSRLLLIGHHLIIDGVSWRIVIEDLQTAYEQLSQGLPVNLPPKTTSLEEWSKRLTRFAQTSKLQDDFVYWQKLLQQKSRSIPLDREVGDNSEGATSTVWCHLGREDTRALFETVAAKIGAYPYELLLTALSRVICEWIEGTDLLIDLEGHGREDLFPDLNITRTVGWFTSLFPFRIESRKEESFAETLGRVRKNLGTVPRRGLSFGLIRYLSSELHLRQALAEGAQAEICFNYLGQFHPRSAPGFEWTPAREVPGSARSPSSDRVYGLKVTARVINEEMYLDWSFSTGLLNVETIERLAKSYLRQLTDFISRVKGTTEDASERDREQASLFCQKISSSGLPMLGRHCVETVEVPQREMIEFKHVFLTGATGYLGAYLLRELLIKTDADICCLVRAEDSEAAFKRVVENLQWYFPKENYQGFGARLRAVAGDVRFPQLGLAEHEYAELSKTVEAIFHAAADVRLIGDPAEIISTNVGGTQRVIDFATHNRTKVVHHVSTLGIFGSPQNGRPMTLDERDFDVTQEFRNPYHRSKYEAEKLIRAAMARGLPAVVYRSGNVAADSHTGKFQRNIEQNRIYLNLRACINMGVAPYLPHTSIGFSYVDVVAKGIVALSQLCESNGSTFHVENSHTLSYYDLTRVLQSFGYAIALLRADEYIDKIAGFSNTGDYLMTLESIWGHGELDDAGRVITYDCSRTESQLKELNVVFPPPDVPWLRRLVQHCVDVNFLQPPMYWDRVSNSVPVLNWQDDGWATARSSSTPQLE